MTLTLSIARSAAEIETCLRLRWEVFVVEQGVSEADEIDGEDGHCIHVLATQDTVPIGAARFQYVSPYAKIQRVCVLPEGRGLGVGAALIRFMLDEIRAEGRVSEARLGAQTHALDFYRGLGFEAFGAVYDDAGIPHMDMKRAL